MFDYLADTWPPQLGSGHTRVAGTDEGEGDEWPDLTPSAACLVSCSLPELVAYLVECTEPDVFEASALAFFAGAIPRLVRADQAAETLSRAINERPASRPAVLALLRLWMRWVLTALGGCVVCFLMCVTGVRQFWDRDFREDSSMLDPLLLLDDESAELARALSATATQPLVRSKGE